MIEQIRSIGDRVRKIPGFGGAHAGDTGAGEPAQSAFGGRRPSNATIEATSAPGTARAQPEIFDAKADDAYYGGMNRFANWWARVMDFGSWKIRARFHGNIAKHVAQEHGLAMILKEWRERYDARGDMRAAALGRILDRMDAGAYIEDAMKEYVPPMERVMIMVGRESGRLDIGFEQAKFVAESVGRLKSVVRAGLAYPAILFAMLGVMLTLVSFMLVPVLEGLLPVAKWPFVSKTLYWMAYAVRHYGLWALGSLIVGSLAMRWILPNWTGRARRFADRWLPIFTLYRENVSSTFLIAVASLIQSGQSFGGGINKIAELATPWLRSHITQMQEKLAEGTPPAGSMNTGMLPLEVIDTIAVFQKANQLEVGLSEIGKSTTVDAIERIEAIVAVARGIALLMIGGVLLLMVIGSFWVTRAMIRDYNLPISL